MTGLIICVEFFYVMQSLKTSCTNRVLPVMLNV
jgi:hypothetical protein